MSGHFSPPGVIAFSVVAAVGVAMQMPSAQTPPSSAYAELRKLSKNVNDRSLSEPEARQVGLSLARHNVGAELMAPVPVSEVILEQLAGILADNQLAWQERRTGDIRDVRLLRAINQHLELENGPGYLMLRERELRNVRLYVWMRVPELSGGVERRAAHLGQQVVGPLMSPFEAFLASDVLLHEKLLNDDFVRTDQEIAIESSARLRTKPGIYFLRPNPRRHEFREHLLQMMKKKWQTADEVLRVVGAILEESHEK